MGLFLGLSQRELAQVGMGTHLMLNSLNIEARLVLAGGGSIMEYLTMPQDESYSCAPLPADARSTLPTGLRGTVAVRRSFSEADNFERAWLADSQDSLVPLEFWLALIVSPGNTALQQSKNIRLLFAEP